MGFCQWPEMGSKWVKSGFWYAKAGENRSIPTFLPTLDPSQDIDQDPFVTHFKGGGNCFQKGPWGSPDLAWLLDYLAGPLSQRPRCSAVARVLARAKGWGWKWDFLMWLHNNSGSCSQNCSESWVSHSLGDEKLTENRLHSRVAPKLPRFRELLRERRFHSESILRAPSSYESGHYRSGVFRAEGSVLQH